MNAIKLVLVGLGIVALHACASAPSSADDVPPWFSQRFDSLVAASMRRFRSAEEFESYRSRLHNIAEREGLWWAAAPPDATGPLFAAVSIAPAEPCEPALEECNAGEQLEEIILTGSRVGATQSITNNQEAGVDEGDIVKQYGRFLIILHDGRLFSVDTGASPGTMVFVDRINVYPTADRGTWYDELLITDDRLIVTGYDYDQEASELALFRIDSIGVFTHEATYYITSDDYYSEDNYASRLVDGSLVLYTPLWLIESDTDKPLEFPQVRRWTAAQGYSEWQPLFAPTDIYFPIQRTLVPVVHTVSVCPLGGESFRCRSTGLIGPETREFYVSPDYAYVWASNTDYDLSEWGAEACAEGVTAGDFRALPAALYRIPLGGGRALAALTAGTPPDQFSLDAREDRFLALLRWIPGDCETDEDFPLRYARIPQSAFSSRPTPVPLERYATVPTPPGYDIHNRFTDRYLVYGSSEALWTAGGYDYSATNLVAVPVESPRSYTTVPLAHSAERVEVFGDNIVVDGYRGAGAGLTVSTVDLRERPAVGSVSYLEGVLESEGRSHAFNGLVERDGSGIFGLPTVFRQPSRWLSFDDTKSNVHFFTVDTGLSIGVAGYLAAEADAIDEDYECEVSCVDWYGNARPIFMNGRIFALTSTELVEARLVNRQIIELQRVGVTGTPLHRR